MSRQLFIDGKIVCLTRGIADYGLVTSGSIVVEDERIRWVGSTVDLPEEFADCEWVELEGRLVTPALIDCHTHLVFGGDRAAEFELRLNGATYEEVARAGGGIVSSVKATRACSEDELVAAALPRLDALLAEGVCTVEIKSGYGLTIEDEMKMLRAARRLGQERSVRVRTSWLAAHAVPPEYRDRADAYIDEVAIPGLELAHAEGLVDAVDGFCEGIAFSVSQIERVFEKARALGIPVKLHAEQLSNLGGAKLAAQCGGLSADHLEYLDDEGVRALAESGSVAVLLPGAYYMLRETQAPPVAALRAAGVPMAIATDANPGSSPIFSLLTTMNLACTLFRLTPEEALAGVTREAAVALGLGEELGTIEVGKRAELAVWDVERPAELAYRMGFNPLHRTICAEDGSTRGN